MGRIALGVWNGAADWAGMALRMVAVVGMAMVLGRGISGSLKSDMTGRVVLQARRMGSCIEVSKHFHGICTFYTPVSLKVLRP